MQPVALITVASRGIGAACAAELASRGYRLAVMSRSDRIHDVAACHDGAAATTAPPPLAPTITIARFPPRALPSPNDQTPRHLPHVRHHRRQDPHPPLA